MQENDSIEAADKEDERIVTDRTSWWKGLAFLMVLAGCILADRYFHHPLGSGVLGVAFYILTRSRLF